MNNIFIRNGWLRRLLTFLVIALVLAVRSWLSEGQVSAMQYLVQLLVVAIVFAVLWGISWLFTRKSIRAAAIVDAVILGMLLLSVTLFNMQVGSSYSVHNEEIPADVRKVIDDLDARLAKSISDDDPETMFKLFTIEAQGQGMDEVERIYREASPLYWDSSLEPYNQYYTRATGPRVITPSETDDAFLITYVATTNESVVSLKLVDRPFADYLQSSIYVKKDGEWRLQKFHMGLFALGGKTAIKWYKEAKEFEDKGYLVPAYLRMDLARSLIKPAPFIAYKKEKDIQNDAANMLDKINKRYVFPIAIDAVSTKPEIVGVKPQFVKDKLYSRILYKTNLPFSDEGALKKEAQEMKEHLLKMFPGIGENLDNLLLLAYQEIPDDPQKKYPTYGIILDM